LADLEVGILSACLCPCHGRHPQRSGASRPTFCNGEPMNDLQLLTRDEFFAAEPSPRVDYVTLPHPNPQVNSLGRIKMRGHNATEMMELGETLYHKGKLVQWRNDKFREIMAARCCINEDGTRMFEDEVVRSVHWTKARPAFVSGLIAAARRLTDEVDVEDELKNSEPTGGNDSPCELPLGSDSGTITTPPA